MTRKRFVKLCMANGYSRNSANRIAEKVNSSGKSYADAYKALAAVKKLTVALTPALSEAIANVAKSIGNMASALSAGFSAFSNAVRDALTSE